MEIYEKILEDEERFVMTVLMLYLRLKMHSSFILVRSSDFWNNYTFIVREFLLPDTFPQSFILNSV